jgi:hypothetical protein
MRTTGREIIDVLEKVADLDWFRYTRIGSDGTTTHAPITVWRFTTTDTDNEAAEQIVSALRSVLDGFSGHMSWSLKFTGRNWVLLPTHVQDLEDSGRFRTDGELLDHLLREDPGLATRAAEDLGVIAHELARSLGMRS